MAPRAGFEPTTNALTVHDSTTELPGNCLVCTVGIEPTSTVFQTAAFTRLAERTMENGIPWGNRTPALRDALKGH